MDSLCSSLSPDLKVLHLFQICFACTSVLKQGGWCGKNCIPADIIINSHCVLDIVATAEKNLLKELVAKSITSFGLLCICSHYYDVYSHIGSAVNTKMNLQNPPKSNDVFVAIFVFIRQRKNFPWKETALRDISKCKLYRFICKHNYCVTIFCFNYMLT